MIAIADLEQEIHPKDTMLTASRESYFKTSLSALAAIDRAVLAAGKRDFKTILDFGCGYGRVLRAIRARWPDATIVAADLIADAVEFCARAFDCIPIQGTTDPNGVALPCKFDLIWVGSVFTHLPGDAWRPTLQYLADQLELDGLLVFTAHGRAALWVVQNHTLGRAHISPLQFEVLKQDFRTVGFGFAAYGDPILRHINAGSQSAIPSGGYGLSFSRIDWVCRLIGEFPQLTLQCYTEGGWGNNHDVAAVCRPKDLRTV